MHRRDQEGAVELARRFSGVSSWLKHGCNTKGREGDADCCGPAGLCGEALDAAERRTTREPVLPSEVRDDPPYEHGPGGIIGGPTRCG